MKFHLLVGRGILAGRGPLFEASFEIEELFDFTIEILGAKTYLYSYLSQNNYLYYPPYYR